MHNGAQHIAFDALNRLGLCEIKLFAAQYPTPHDCCVRFATVVTSGPATLARGRLATALPPPDFHRLESASFAWRTEILCDRCGLAHGVATFEIGAGTGTATHRLLDLGAKPLVAVEPDARMADFLRETVQDQALTVVCSSFEDAVLDEASFDLGVSATAFHWLNEELALAKVAKLLRLGGWWAMVWNVFGDDSRPDPFHEATKTLHGGPSSTSVGVRGIPFALDVEARVAAIERTRAFNAVEHRTSAWSLVLDADQTVALDATYSNVNIHQDRQAVLAELGRIARDEFHGCVTCNMVTSLYVAQRRAR